MFGNFMEFLPIRLWEPLVTAGRQAAAGLHGHRAAPEARLPEEFPMLHGRGNGMSTPGGLQFTWWFPKL